MIDGQRNGHRLQEWLCLRGAASASDKFSSPLTRLRDGDGSPTEALVTEPCARRNPSPAKGRATVRLRARSCRASFPTGPIRATAGSGRTPGNRGNGEGALWNVGNNGYSWSSTSYDSGDHYRGMYLNFNATELNPSNTTNRANGLQLRCLSVFISPLPFFYPEPRQTRYFAARCLISRFVISHCTSSGDETAR